ncbi:MAG: pentapeptide repeat-containing protein [Rhodospirillaceae bacterium]|nr:pentapeptide repeat-containing protein [Rhodospirillaceae bacterium]
MSVRISIRKFLITITTHFQPEVELWRKAVNMACVYTGNTGERCQFQDGELAKYENNIVEQLGGQLRFDKAEYCAFHLPAWDRHGRPLSTAKLNAHTGPKREWSASSVELFVRCIHEIMRDGRSDRLANLKGVVLTEGYEFLPDCDDIFVDFTQSMFAPTTQIQNVKFGSGSRFAHAIFCPRVDFSGSIFGKNTDFSQCRFEEDIDFSGVLVGDDANFAEASFGRSFNSSKTEFGDRVIFRNSHFGLDANFSQSTFGIGAIFSSAQFGQFCEFDGATFGPLADFINSIIPDGTSFKNCTFGTNAKFSGTLKSIGATSFVRAVFLGDVRFADREFTGAVDFSNAEFNGIPDFHGAKPHQGMNFHEARFKCTRGADDDEKYRAEQAYRTLKLAMANISAMNEQAEFFALEMDCRRQRGTATWSERFLATLYKYGSDYGRDLARPLIWFGFLFLFSSVFAAILVHKLGKADPGWALQFVTSQTVRPFSGLVSGKQLVDVPIDPRAAHPIIFGLFSLIYSLGVIGLTTLFILAIRRRFRMA